MKISKFRFLRHILAARRGGRARRANASTTTKTMKISKFRFLNLDLRHIVKLCMQCEVLALAVLLFFFNFISPPGFEQFSFIIRFLFVCNHVRLTYD